MRELMYNQTESFCRNEVYRILVGLSYKTVEVKSHHMI